MQKDIPQLYAKDKMAWYEWLEQNYDKQKNVWLIIYKKNSGTPSITYNEAVDMALCFGWIDSKPNKRDENSFLQFFSQRNPKSNWSKVNKLKVERLIEDGLMAKAGYKMIEIAKANGTWNALDEVDNLVIPPDMETLFQKNLQAKTNFEAFPPSVKRGILEWILNAKQPDTRKKRIEETVNLATENIRANQWKK